MKITEIEKMTKELTRQSEQISRLAAERGINLPEEKTVDKDEEKEFLSTTCETDVLKN